ncbi:MAG: hypothetical protein AB1598_06925 [Thermodesulfobacteriota bacterium]
MINIILSSVKPDYRAVRAVLFRLAAVLLVLVVSSVIVLIGLGFFVWSLYLYLETLFSPYWAALISGAGAIALAVVIVLIALLATGYLKRGGRVKPKPARARAGESCDPMELVQRYPLESGLTAAIAGFIVGSSDDAPKTLTEFLTLLKESDPK